MPRSGGCWPGNRPPEVPGRERDDAMISSPNDELYPQPTPELSRLRRELAPRPTAAFQAFSESVFAEGALSAKTKNIIAVAVAHVTQCPYCIKGHTRAALRHGASRQELAEAIWVSAEMRAGAAFA